MNSFLFKPLQEKDLNLLYQWFQEPTINQWYARGRVWSLEEIKVKYEPRILGLEQVPSFIVCRNNTPVGFIQYYSLETSFPEGVQRQDNLLFQHYKPKNLVGIDLFIAEENQRGKGIGVKIIHQFIENFLNQFAAVVVDPEANNSKALRCYEKAGFIRTQCSENPNYIILIKRNQSGKLGDSRWPSRL